MTLRIHHWLPRIQDTLGPGCRVAVWVQGCSQACPGCMAPETWDRNGGRKVDVDALAEQILDNPDHEGLTVSGGEPFAQAAPVAELLQRVRAAGWNTWVYTGWLREDLQARRDPDVDRLLAAADVLVDGPYRADRAGTFPFRGSSNQRILLQTGAIPESRVLAASGARVQVTLDDAGGMVIVGIPPPHFMERLHEALERRGIRVVIPASRR